MGGFTELMGCGSRKVASFIAGRIPKRLLLGAASATGAADAAGAEMPGRIEGWYMDRRFDAFVFDLDGTLLDTLPDLMDVTNETLAHFGYPLHTEAEILHMVGNGLRSLISQAVPDGLDEGRVSEAVAHWKAVYDERGSVKTAPYEGMLETLFDLRKRGYKTAVLSNKYNGGVQEVVRNYLDGLMDYALGEGPVPRKPDPTGLLQVAKVLEVEPLRIAYIGDSSVDMQAARNAGAFALGATWGYQSTETLVANGADALIAHPKDLLDYA